MKIIEGVNTLLRKYYAVLIIGAILLFVFIGDAVPSIVTIVLGIYGYFQNEKDKKEIEKIREELLEERTERKILQGQLQEKDTTILDLKEDKKNKEEKVDYILKALERKGITTEYIVRKYNKSINSVLILFSHQKPPRFIREKIESMGGRVSDRGKLGVLPPVKCPQGNIGEKELREWFKQKFLADSNIDYEYRVHLLPIDLKNKYSTEKIDKDTAKNLKEMTLIRFFKVTDLVDYEKVWKLVNDEISLKDEIKENVGLLAIPVATKKQLDIILKPENQLEIQKKIGNITQLLNTTPEEIEGILSEYKIDNADVLAKDLKKEAEYMKEHLNL